MWNTSLAPAQTINTTTTGIPTNAPAGRWRAMYDATNFYFLIEINDTYRWGNPSSTSGYWNGDAVEICVKTGTPAKNQIGFGYVSNGTPRVYGDYTASECKMADVTSNYSGNPGYILEVRIPKSGIAQSSLTTGGELYMEVCVNQTSNGTNRQAQLATYSSSDTHWNTYAGYTALLLADCKVSSISALNGKTTVCSNGTDFASLVANISIPDGATVQYLWKKDGVTYTGKGSDWNNIRPTAPGVYTCDVTVTIGAEITTTTSNSITITSSGSCSDFKSSLPIFVVSTNGTGFPADASKTKIQCDVKVIWNGDGIYNSLTDMAGNANVYYDRKAIMNYRGSTSRTFAKKPFAFATGKKNLEDGDVKKGNYAMFGLPEEKDWILFPSYGDKSLIRYKLAMNLYSGMGYYASSMRYVDLYIDGDYRGVYIFMEKYEVGIGRINVTEDSDTAQPSEIGYVYKLDKTEHADDAICWTRTTTNCGGPCGVGGCGDQSYYTPMRYELVYPEDDAVDFSNKMSYIQDEISKFEKALNAASTDADFAAIYENQISMVSFADYFIIAELAKVSDAYRISMFFSKDAGGKIKCTPIWDYDMGFGNSTTHGSFNTNAWQYNGDNSVNEAYFPIPFWWNKLMTNACFKSVVRTRWEELRTGVLSSTNIESIINDAATLLTTDVDGAGISPYQRNRNKWSWSTINSCGGSDYTCPWHIPSWTANYAGVGNPSGKTTEYLTQEIPLMKAWITNRLNWMDAQIMNASFGSLLDGDQFNQCSKKANDFGVNIPETKTENTSIKIIYDDNSFMITSLDMKNPIQTVTVYDINGSLLGEKRNVNDIYCELETRPLNQKVAVVKVQTLKTSESQILLLK